MTFNEAKEFIEKNRRSGSPMLEVANESSQKLTGDDILKAMLNTPPSPRKGAK